MGIERVPPPCALFPIPLSPSFSCFRCCLLLSLAAARCDCFDGSVCIYVFVYKSMSSRGLLPYYPLTPSSSFSLSLTCIFMSKRRFIIFGRRPKQCNAKKMGKKEKGRQGEGERGIWGRGGMEGVNSELGCGTSPAVALQPVEFHEL